LFVALCVAFFLWTLFWLICRPVVILHYDEGAREPVVYFFNNNHSITKDELRPGQVERFYSELFPEADSFMDISLPMSSRDGVEIKPPFSRVDVYINGAAKIEKVETKFGFFDRFGAR
jgi:hypothetical protein